MDSRSLSLRLAPSSATLGIAGRSLELLERRRQSRRRLDLWLQSAVQRDPSVFLVFLSLVRCSTVMFGCVPCFPVYLVGWVTLQLETLGCVWLLLETLITFGCVPYSFAETLLLSAGIASDVMFGLLLCLPGCVPCFSFVWLCTLPCCISYV